MKALEHFDRLLLRFTIAAGAIASLAMGAAIAARLFVYVFVPVEAQAPAPAWSVVNNPAVNTQATASQAAAGAGLRNFADCISATYMADTTAPAATTVTLNVRDGATGAGTVIWTGDLSLPATASASAPPLQLCGLGLRGSTNTAMTIEFAAAGGANTFQAVSMKGRVGQ